MGVRLSQGRSRALNGQGCFTVIMIFFLARQGDASVRRSVSSVCANEMPQRFPDMRGTTLPARLFARHPCSRPFCSARFLASGCVGVYLQVMQAPIGRRAGFGGPQIYFRPVLRATHQRPISSLFPFLLQPPAARSTSGLIPRPAAKGHSRSRSATRWGGQVVVVAVVQ